MWAFRSLYQNVTKKLIFRNHSRKISLLTLHRQYQTKIFLLTTMENLPNRMITRSISSRLKSSFKTESPLSVSHNEEEKEFFIEIQDDDRKEGNPKAILTYEWENTKLADLQHTYVPEEFRGKGVAKLLAKTAFEHFVSKGVTMKLTCTYLQKYAKDSQDQRYNDNICWDSVCN